MPLNWQAIVDDMTNVQKLVHLAARYDSVDIERIRGELLQMRRTAYESELGIQAEAVGCGAQRANLTNSEIITQLNDIGQRDAQSIANTYNYFLATAIIRAGMDNTRGNRFYYAKAIREWEPTYWQWKNPQIVEFTDNQARALAQKEFYQRNGRMIGARGPFGSAKLEPRAAVCPICLGWIARGIVPLYVAMNNPPPYHVKCPHVWDTRPSQLTAEDCARLWMGE